MDEATTLFRPVGQKELDLIHDSGFRAFPPRLFFQPIFYPVLTEEYAAGIARNWNLEGRGVGVRRPRDEVRRQDGLLAPVRRPDRRQLGPSRQYWIPAERLAEFNENIVGLIEVVAEFRPDTDEG